MERQSKLSSIPRVDSFTSHLGLVVMLGGMAMFFITLFVSQSILENRFGVSYMPGGGSTFLFHSSMNTMVLIVASLLLEMGWQKLRKDDSNSAILYQGSTLFASVVFLVSQVGLWNRMISAGFLPSTDLMGAFFYAFTGLHGLHIVGAVGTLGWLFWKMHTIEESELLIRWTVNARMFVHFLTVVWLFIFVRLFVMV